MFPSRPNFRKLDITSSDGNLNQNLVNKEFCIFIMKFIVSLILIISGLWFIYLGIKSDSVIEITTKLFSLKLNKTFPGISLAILGFLLILFSRLNIKIKTPNSN